MYLNRERAVRVMAEHGLDALVATAVENIFYLTGFYDFNQVVVSDTQAYAVARRDALDRPTLVVGRSSVDLALVHFPYPDRIVPAGTFYREVDPEAHLSADDAVLNAVANERATPPNVVEGLVAVLQEQGLADGVIGVDEKGILPANLEEVKRRLPRLIVMPGRSAIRQIRMVKTPGEVLLLKAAARITERAMLDALRAARPGMSEARMARVFEKSLIDQGARPAFTILNFGARTAPCNLPSSKEARLEPGDLIRFDIGCFFQGYYSDIARNAFFGGKPPDRLARYYRAILAGERRAIDRMRPGVTAAQVFEAAVAGTRAAGIPHYRRHHVGHGVGVEVYDLPLLAPGNDTPLEEGMVFEVETPYYELGFGGLQVEDTVLVTHDGAELLTESSREIHLVG